ncbi:transglutaminase-like cysteine peptidase [Niveibacterium terrae]|uniref:transglutaminase-like cysteine peptidase n=1 Tax=Niveibacterium terrae TaxID=3373598 RepID=UPI003A9391E7
MLFSLLSRSSPSSIAATLLRRLALLGALLCLFAWAAVGEDAALVAVAAQRYGAGGAGAVREWRALLSSLRGQSEADQLRRVNDFVNRRIRFAEDSVVWQQADYWATPVESLGRGLGDCEDYVIAKYFSLRELGVPTAKLRLIYARARIGGPHSSVTQAHMVLGYFATPQAVPLVLDNLLGEIRPATQRTDLAPVFSFNGDGVYAGAATTPVERITRWKELLLRMQAEGYSP